MFTLTWYDYFLAVGFLLINYLAIKEVTKTIKINKQFRNRINLPYPKQILKNDIQTTLENCKQGVK